MAQAAISIQMDQAVGVTTMPEKMSLQVATKMLKNFRKVSLEIEKRECKVKATGKGIIDKYFQLFAAGKAYVAESPHNNPGGVIYKEKFERIFGEQAACAEEAGQHEDAAPPPEASETRPAIS